MARLSPEEAIKRVREKQAAADRLARLCPFCDGGGKVIQRLGGHPNSALTAIPQPPKRPPKFGTDFLLPPGMESSWVLTSGLIFGLIEVPCPLCCPQPRAKKEPGERRSRAPKSMAPAAGAATLVYLYPRTAPLARLDRPIIGVLASTVVRHEPSGVCSRVTVSRGKREIK